VIDRESKNTERLSIDNSIIEPKGESKLIDAHIEEYEKYAEEERALRDKIRSQIVHSADEPLETTPGIVDRALWHGDVDPKGQVPSYSGGGSWWELLGTMAQTASASLRAMIAFVQWW
jgi:hypothetical protein